MPKFRNAGGTDTRVTEGRHVETSAQLLSREDGPRVVLALIDPLDASGKVTTALSVREARDAMGLLGLAIADAERIAHELDRDNRCPAIIEDPGRRCVHENGHAGQHRAPYDPGAEHGPSLVWGRS